MSLNDSTMKNDSEWWSREISNKRKEKNMTPKNKSVDLGLVCRKRNYTYDNHNRVRSGDWVIHEKHRGRLIGRNVVLTDGQKKPAYIGGRIVGFNPTYDNRVEVIFIEDKSLAGSEAIVSHRKWANDKCYVE